MIFTMKMKTAIPIQPFFEIDAAWHKILSDELHAPYLAELAAYVKSERTGNTPVYPPEELVFNAFLKTAFNDVKVVILGQDPYHGPNQATGLSFSVPQGVVLPPSLKNIFKELKSDIGLESPSHGCLNYWAEQGVLLLNAILTVREGTPLSHQKKGWERFTDLVVKKLVERKGPIVFLLWGKYAQQKCFHFLKDSDQGEAIFLKAPHPSPFSVHQGFFGCRHFSQANAFLIEHGIKPIDWQLN